MEDLEQDRRLGPAEAAEVCDYLCMHGYPLYADWARGDLDAALLPFLGLVTRVARWRRPLCSRSSACRCGAQLGPHGGQRPAAAV